MFTNKTINTKILKSFKFPPQHFNTDYSHTTSHIISHSTSHTDSNKKKCDNKKRFSKKQPKQMRIVFDSKKNDHQIIVLPFDRINIKPVSNIFDF